MKIFYRLILFILFLVFVNACGYKGDPYYYENNESNKSKNFFDNL